MNLKIKNGIIVGAGFCDFTAELKDGETQVECDGLIPENINTHYQYDPDSKLLYKRDVPLTEIELWDTINPEYQDLVARGKLREMILDRLIAEELGEDTIEILAKIAVTKAAFMQKGE